MGRPKNAMEVFALLPKSNCRQCGEKTCLAFASAVYTGQKLVSTCPFLSPETIVRFSDPSMETGFAEEQLPPAALPVQQLRDLDFEQAAHRVGGLLQNGRLTVKVLGKDFSVDQDGRFSSDIHIIPWITEPLLAYILVCQGVEPTGKWMSMRELEGGRERYPLFQRRCEDGLRQLADISAGLFDDMVHLFQGRHLGSNMDADISVVLPVLPKVPLMISYWKPADGMISALKIFFDQSVNRNLGVEGAFTLGSGLGQMFEKLAENHGHLETKRPLQ